MANIAASNVTNNDVWTEDGTNGRLFLAKDVSIDFATVNAGGATNTVPASAFGMTKISRAHNFRITATNVMLHAWPSADGTILLLAAASTGTPADQSAVAQGIVVGR